MNDENRDYEKMSLAEWVEAVLGYDTSPTQYYVSSSGYKKSNKPMPERPDPEEYR